MFDVDDIILVTLDFVTGRNSAVLIDDDIADRTILIEDAVTKDNGTGNLGAFFDSDATADDGIFDGSFNHAAIGDETVGDLTLSTIDGWRSVMGAGEDWPIFVEEGFVWLSIKKLERIFNVMGKAIESSRVAIKWNAMDLRWDEVACSNAFKVFGNAPRRIDAVAMVDHLD